MLAFLEKLTLSPAEIDAADAFALRNAGISEQAVTDAILVCTYFNIIDRVADSLNFAVPSPEDFARTANMRRTHSYAPVQLE